MSVESYLATVQRAIRWALRDLTKIMEDVDLSDPDAARDRLQAELPGLVVVWGEIAATQAAEYFEELIEAPAVLADPVAPEAVESMVGWAVGPLYGEKQPDGTVTPPDPAKARRNLQGGFERHVANTGRDTVRLSAENTPGVGWARVLQGEENCAWCVTMASRGAVFSSRETASMVSTKDPLAAEAHKTHTDCDCRILAIRDDSDYPPGYDPAKYYNMYLEARKRAGIKDVRGGRDARGIGLKNIPDSEKDILQLMQEMYGMH